MLFFKMVTNQLTNNQLQNTKSDNWSTTAANVNFLALIYYASLALFYVPFENKV